MTENLVVILTALDLEYKAVLEKMVDPQLHRHEKGTLFDVGTLRGTTCRVALGSTGKGNQSSAVLAERAIQEFSPVAVLFVGVAGALWDHTQLGDVVMATHVYAYQGGTSEDDGLKARPRVWETAHRISELAARLSHTADWADKTPAGTRTPTVYFGAIAAGDIVHNSRISYEAKWIREHYNDALPGTSWKGSPQKARNGSPAIPTPTAFRAVALPSPKQSDTKRHRQFQYRESSGITNEPDWARHQLPTLSLSGKRCSRLSIHVRGRHVGRA